jgi:CRISPR-associated protein Csd1
MLVQALAGYADNYLADALNDIAWEMKPVAWLIDISPQGTFLGAIPRMTTEIHAKKQVQVPQQMSVPRSPVARVAGHHPLLAVDDIMYVLGRGPWTPDRPSERDKAEKHYAAFVALIQKAAAQTGEPVLDACARFYADPAQVARAREALREVKPGSLVGLSVEGPVVSRPVVQSFWRSHYQAAYAERIGDSQGECLITGKTGPIAPTHEKIKGLSSLGGQAAGVALMSFDKDAFRSYGWEQNRNSPMSPDRAMAYVLALNDLLKQGKVVNRTRRDKAGIGFVFWLKDPGALDPFEYLDPPDTATVDALLELDPRASPDENVFYLAGLSGNGGRLRVRYWVMDSLVHVKSNLQEWHRQLRVFWPWEEDPGPIRLWQLEYVLDREGKPPSHQTLALVRRAIEGVAQPLSYSMLSMALKRLRHPEQERKAADRKKDPMRLQRLRVPVGLIRISLNDILRKNGESEVSEGLDENCAAPAYICGRLMAEFENLQRQSSESNVNSSVLDRYFSMASTYPAAAFPKIESLAQKHLRKLRRDKRGVAIRIDERLQELHNKLQPGASGGFPSKLDLEGQGLFALGYYHQKAWSIAQARERKDSNKVANTDQENA